MLCLIFNHKLKHIGIAYGDVAIKENGLVYRRIYDAYQCTRCGKLLFKLEN